jgi:hypothetical protein
MIGAVIDAHVNPAGHVALNTLGPAADLVQDFPVLGPDGLSRLTCRFMKMMILRIVLIRAVALKAKGVAAFHDLGAVHVMAVAAAHVPMVHFTLGKGTVDIDLVFDLAVRVVEMFVKQR